MSHAHIANSIVRPAGRQTWPGVLFGTIPSPLVGLAGILGQPRIDAVRTAGPLPGSLGDFTGSTDAFLWRDSSGATWMVQIADDEFQDPDRLIFGANYRGCGWVLDSARRRQAIQALEDRIECCSQPAQSREDPNSAKYASWTRRLRKLRLADDAERILEYLWRRSGGEWGSPVRISAKELGVALRPPHGRFRVDPPVDQLAVMLRATLGFGVARLAVDATSQALRVVQESTAVTDFEEIDAGRFWLHIPPLFAEVATAFVQANGGAVYDAHCEEVPDCTEIPVC